MWRTPHRKPQQVLIPTNFRRGQYPHFTFQFIFFVIFVRSNFEITRLVPHLFYLLVHPAYTGLHGGPTAILGLEQRGRRRRKRSCRDPPAAARTSPRLLPHPRLPVNVLAVEQWNSRVVQCCLIGAEFRALVVVQCVVLASCCWLFGHFHAK